MISNCGISNGFVCQAGEAPAQTLPKDVVRNNIMPYLTVEDCGAMAKVCKQWNLIVAKPILVATLDGTKVYMSALDRKVWEESFFGKRKWEQIPGIYDVGEDPLFTEDEKMTLVAELKKPCGFFNEADQILPHRFQNEKLKRKRQTQIILLFPESINNEKRNFDLTDRLFRFERKGNHDGVFVFAVGGKSAKYRNLGVRPSYCAFVTLDVIPGSRQASQHQKRNLTGRIGYRLPETVNEASTLELFLNRNFDPLKENNHYFFGVMGQFPTFMATNEPDEFGRVWVVGAAGCFGSEVRNLNDGNVNVGAVALMEVQSVLGRRNIRH